jgi:hypothetical protein
MHYKFIDSEEVQNIIDSSPPGNNTKFLSSSHSLWTRFKNYNKSPPIALEIESEIVAMIYATFNRDGYTNLYEIVTLQGKEGKGYASKVWDHYIEYAVNERRSTRLKISCTPSSVTWHMKNGLVFWAIDPSGSLRSDQPLYKSREEQLNFRNEAIKNPDLALPSEKQCQKFREESLESYKFGKKKLYSIQNSIELVGDSWLRDALFESTLLDVL